MSSEEGTSTKRAPIITGTSVLKASEARWITLNKIYYIDEGGEPRTWESASRKTRASSGVDAVAIGNIILHPARPPSTVLVIQYRPPLDAYSVEWPAGLIDEGETPEQAALRELSEETGYGNRPGSKLTVLSTTPTLSSDPGLSSANLQMVMVEVQLDEGVEPAEQRLDDGEHIQRVVVPLSELYARLVEYSKRERTVVAAKLFHWAAGMEFMKGQKYF